MRLQISESLLSLCSYIPHEFDRKPRSLAELDRWKATEFRLLLLYTGPVVLKGKLPKEMYDNFMLLSTAIRVLVSPTLDTSFCDYVTELLVCFVQHYAELYGEDEVVYNIHCVVHLAKDAKLHGPLDRLAAFPFENYLGRLKKMVRKPTVFFSKLFEGYQRDLHAL